MMTKKVKNYAANFDRSQYDSVMWRLRFDGMNFVADISFFNSPELFYKFFEDIVAGKEGLLELDDEGDFFVVKARYDDHENPDFVTLELQEAREGRRARVLISAEDFVVKTITRLQQFKNSKLVHETIFEKYQDDAEIKLLANKIVKKWGLPQYWRRDYFNLAKDLSVDEP